MMCIEPFVVAEQNRRCFPLVLTLRECITAITNIRFLLGQIQFVQDIEGNTKSFRPHFSSYMAKCISELCTIVSSHIELQPVFVDVKLRGISISCPVCTEELTSIHGIRGGDCDLSVEKLDSDFIECMHCGMGIDTCFFTLLPHMKCSLDECFPPTLSLKCSLCGVMCNTSRQNASPENRTRQEYFWVPQTSFDDVYCPYCSIFMLPTNFL